MATRPRGRPAPGSILRRVDKWGRHTELHAGCGWHRRRHGQRTSMAPHVWWQALRQWCHDLWQRHDGPESWRRPRHGGPESWRRPRHGAHLAAPVSPWATLGSLLTLWCWCWCWQQREEEKAFGAPCHCPSPSWRPFSYLRPCHCPSPSWRPFSYQMSAFLIPSYRVVYRKEAALNE